MKKKKRQDNRKKKYKINLIMAMLKLQFNLRLVKLIIFISQNDSQAL